MTNKEWALYYQKNGWSIIPIRPDTKKPCLNSWKEYQNKLPTTEEIEKWWADWPWASIALITGKLSGISLIDVDSKYKGEEFFGETVWSKTGGDGRHYLYDYDPALKQTQGLEEGLDIRNDGGYAIMPESTHKSGKQYLWQIEPFKNSLCKLP